MLRIFLAALLFLSPLCSCRTVADGSDDSAPELTLRYRVGDTPWIDVSTGGASVTVTREDRLTLWANAFDEGGVEEARLRASGTRRCATGGGGGGPGSPGSVTVDSWSISEDSVAPPEEGVGESTAAARNVVMHLDISSICESGGPRGTSFDVDASASNFAGGVRRSGILEVRVD